jgi:hypothetical protein
LRFSSRPSGSRRGRREPRQTRRPAREPPIEASCGDCGVEQPDSFFTRLRMPCHHSWPRPGAAADSPLVTLDVNGATRYYAVG